MQEETRARIRTRATPMAEYQIEETSYRSVKMMLAVLIVTLQKLKKKILNLNMCNKADNDNRAKGDK